MLVLYNRPAPKAIAASSGETEVLPPLVRGVDDVVAVVEGLRDHDFEVAHVNVEDDIDRVMYAAIVEYPDVIYNLVDNLEADFTQHASVTAYYYLLGIPYTGADPFCLTLCQDRARTHLLLADAGIPLPRFAVVRDVNALPLTDDFRLPLIVTQAFDDVYYDEGFERPVYDRLQLQERVAELTREFELPLLIEEYIEGRRLHVIVIGNRALEVLPITETILPSADDELDEDAGEEDGADAEPEAQPDAGDEPASDFAEERPTKEQPLLHERTILAQLDLDTADRVRLLARRAFRVMGCRDCAQIDFHIDDEGEPHIIDVRPSFDHSPGSPLQVAADSTDRGFAGIVAEITRIACRRAKVLIEEPAPEPLPDEGEMPEAGAGALAEGSAAEADDDEAYDDEAYDEAGEADEDGDEAEASTEEGSAAAEDPGAPEDPSAAGADPSSTASPDPSGEGAAAAPSGRRVRKPPAGPTSDSR